MSSNREVHVSLHISISMENLYLACGHQSTLRNGMQGHIKRRHDNENVEIIFIGDRVYQCEHCDFSHDMKSKYFEHLKDFHDGKQLNRCDLCDTTFTRRSNLMSHIKQVHEGQKRKSPTKKQQGFS